MKTAPKSPCNNQICFHTFKDNQSTIEIFISWSPANLNGVPLQKLKHTAFQFLKCLESGMFCQSVPMGTDCRNNVQIFIATFRVGYGTYVFVASVTTESPDFPGPCIDSMAVE